MKRLVVVAGVLALGACGESAPEAETAVEESAEALPADMSAWEGGYHLVYEDGTETDLVISADGSYQATTGEETISGVITMGDDGSFCYTPEGSEEGECWTNGDAAADGSWPSTSDQGNSVTVTRLEETGEPAA